MIYIIGGANIDIYASSDKDLILKDSNIGNIDITFGGVGNNIACNLKALGEDVKFITAFGGDYFSELIMNDLNTKAIDISESKVFKDEKASIYLAVLDNQNDMSVGINDMKVIDRLNVTELSHLKDIILDEDYLVLDTNLSIEALDFIFNEVKGKKIVEAISVNKVSKIVPYLNLVDLIKLNLLEASSICGIELEDDVKIIAFMKLMKAEGTKEVIVSSKKGLYIGNEKGVEFYHHQYSDIKIVNASGAGDALFSAYIYGKYHGSSTKSCATLGLISAILTLEDNKTNSVIDKTKIKNNIEKANVEGGSIYEY